MDSFDKLKKWLGIKDSLKMFNRDERGIYTKEPIEANKIIIKIHSKYLLEYQKIYSIYPIDEINEANSLVAFYLTKLHVEKDEFWSNYIDTLPKDLDNFPYFWNVKDLNYLKPTSFFLSSSSFGNTNYLTHMEMIMEDFELIYQYNEEKSIISNINKDELWNIFIKFRFLVGSRIFGYVKYGEETSGMVPYIDLLNHSDNPNTIWGWDDSLDSFILVSTKNISKGEELVDNYGNKNNIELLLYYGFTINLNPISILSFCCNSIDYTFDLNYNVDNLNLIPQEEKTQLKIKLNKILCSHKKNITQIKNNHIFNIYLDEIKIINFLLKNF